MSTVVQAGILQNVLEEVDKVVAEFKSMLYKSLKSPGAQPADVERTIKLLLELEPNSDPIWHYLETQARTTFLQCRSGSWLYLLC
jgi:exocyst complex component 2